MQIDHALRSGRRYLVLLALILAAAPFLGVRAAGTSTTATIRYNGTDFEGRQNFQLGWNAEASGTYLVQSANDLSSNSWQTIDSVTSSNAGPVKWMAPEVLRAQKFYRLVLPQPQILGVEPGVVDTTVSNQFLYILGEDLPANADVVIDGVHFTPELINADGVWARISLDGLASGQSGELTVIDLNTSNVVASLSHPFLTTDSSSPYLLEPPTLPPAVPAQNGYNGHPTVLKAIARAGARKGGAIVAADFDYKSSSRLADDGDCDDHDPCVMPFSGEVQQQVADLAIGGRGLDFIWARTYRSRTVDTESAFGPHWTGSYDIRLQPLGGDVVIHDGTGRADTYYLQTNGTYACPGFFREGTLSNNVFRLTFADGGIWEFNPLDGTATAGLLANIMNGDGNVIKLYRDGAGRLSQIVDDLGRTNTVAYNSDGYVQSVTDFSGRTVSYAYYQMGEIGGSPGDLKSVTSPPITGTPNGNDFPDGKTTTYTYSSGYTNDLENHLLLSVIDPLGQTVCQHIYQHNQTDLDFLHCISVQRWTNVPAMLSYLPQTPSPTNQFAVMRCVMNDPEGDVTECFYDAHNRCVTERDFTGRAVPGVAVTDLANRPTAKLRTSDPDFYETDWWWNNDSLWTACRTMGGHEIQAVYQSAFDPVTPARKRADLRVLRELASSDVDMDGDGLADATERDWRFEYDPRFGSEPSARKPMRDWIDATLGGVVPVGNGVAINQKGTGADKGRTADMGKPVRDWIDNSFNGLVPAGNGVAINQKGTGADKGRTAGMGKPMYEWIMASLKVADSRASGAARKNIGLYVSEVSGQSARSGGNVGINEPLPHTTLSASRRGWDGTIKGRLSVRGQDGSNLLLGKSASVFVTSATDPRGYVTTANYDASGNCLHVTRPASDPQSDVEDYAYNAYGQVTTVTNAPDANGYRRVDTFNYYTSGPQAGYLQSIAIDEPGVHLTSAFEYDARGNVTRCVDPRGNDSLFTHNALDQCVRAQSPPNVSARCGTDYYYDANDNLVQCSTELLDASDTLIAIKTNSFQYDALDRLTQIALAVDATRSQTNQFVYDGNGQCVQVLGPDAVSGADPHQMLAYEYDERGLLFHAIAAPDSAFAGTNEFDYDPNGSITAVLKTGGIGGTGGQGGSATGGAINNNFTRDGFGRIFTFTDPLGNQTVYFYDANDNPKVVRQYGELNDVPGSSNNVRLAESRYDYDGLDRCFRTHELFFNPATQSPIGSGDAVSTCVYAPNDECVSMTDSLGRTTSFGYDTACRLSSVTDARGNQVACGRDPAGNVTSVTSTELSDLGGKPQVFSCSYTYDNLNRCVNSSDNVGNTSSYAYDSLDRVVLATDANGNDTTYACDLLDNCLASTNYAGSSSLLPATVVRTSQATYDTSSRCLTSTDANGNTTSYAYDSLGNCTLATRPDGTQHTLVWNSLGDLVIEQDPNGTTITNTYDLCEKIIHRDLACRNVLATTTFETFAYDGCGRLVLASNDVSQLTFSYDSFGDCTGGSQDGLAHSATHDSEGNLLSLTYPSGRVVAYSYDVLDQVTNVSTAGGGVSHPQLAQFAYAGPGRLARITRDNGINSQIDWDGLASPPNAAGDYGWQQVSRVRHGTAALPSLLADVASVYDPLQSKISQADAVSSRSTALTYDVLEQLVESSVHLSGAPLLDTVYVLDTNGNRQQVTTNGVAMMPDYSMSSTVPPGDFQMNRYTTTPFGAQQYDANGNLIVRADAASPTFYQYDYADRLVEVDGLDTNGLVAQVATFTYDALGRRISQTTYPPTPLGPVTTQYVYGDPDSDNDGILESWQSGALVDSFIHQSEDGVRLARFKAGVELAHYLCDDLDNTLALTDAGGNVLEQYSYDDYGRPQFLAADGSPLVDSDGLPVTSSPAGNPYLFHGMEWDGETGLLHDDGSDYFDPQTGRAVRGKVKTVKDMGNNGRAFSGNNPWSGSGGGFPGPVLSEQPRDYLYNKFQNGDIPDQSDKVIPRAPLKGYLERGDKPTQSQFATLIDSRVNRLDDRYLLGLRTSGAGAFGAVHQGGWPGKAAVIMERFNVRQEFGQTLPERRK